MDYNTFFMRVTFLASMSTSKIFIPHYLSGICLCVLSLRSNKCCAALCRSLKWVSEVSLKQHTHSDPTHWRGGKKHKHCTGTIAWEMQARGTPKTQRKEKRNDSSNRRPIMSKKLHRTKQRPKVKSNSIILYK